MSIISTRPDIGGDPEFFIARKRKDKGLQIIPADRVLPDKDHKSMRTGRCGVFFDGVQAEINPNFNTCRESFAKNIQMGLEEAYNMTKIKYPKSNIFFLAYPSVTVNPRNMKGCDPECFRFGCSPDKCVYPSKRIKYPDGKTFMTRFSGGHFHIGYNTLESIKAMKDVDRMTNLLYVLDIIPGVICTGMASDKGEQLRRNYYGRAGAYRIQPHGMEYRTLSSFWLTSPELVFLVSSFVRDAYRIIHSELDAELISMVDMKKIRRAIDGFNKDELLRIYDKVIVPFFETHGRGVSGSPLSRVYDREFIRSLMKDGFQSVFSPKHMLNYWCIKPCNYKAQYQVTAGFDRFINRYKDKEFTLDHVRKQSDANEIWNVRHWGNIGMMH